MSEPPENLDQIHNQGMSAEDAYKFGVQEVDPNASVIFVDPDKIRIRHPGPPGKTPFGSNYQAPARSLRQQMESQVPGSTDAAAKAFEESNGKPLSPRDFALDIKNHDPAAIDNLKINGSEHGLAIVPSHKMDTKEEVASFFLKGNLTEDEPIYSQAEKKSIFENMPGTDNDWMRYIGNHEGAHLFTNEPTYTNFLVMVEEITADRIAMQMAKDRGQGDIALAAKDLRSLAAWVDPRHSSAPLSNNNDQITYSHFNIAQNFRIKIDDYVDENFDWDSYKGEAKETNQLLRENPDAYFEVAQQHLDSLTTKVLEDYNNDPSLDNQRAVYDAQILIGYHKNFEDAYRRRVMGEDIPERAPIQLFSQEQEEAYVKDMHIHSRVSSIEHTLETYPFGIGGEFSKDNVLDNFDWNSYPGAERRQDLSLYESDRLHMEILESKKDEVMKNFEDNPNLETLERVLNLQNAMNIADKKITRNEAIIAKNPLPTFPLEDSIQLISESEKEAVIIHHIQESDAAEARMLKSHQNVGPQPIPVSNVEIQDDENDVQENEAGNHDNDYAPGKDGTAFTVDVAINAGGAPEYDFEKGLQVSGLPMVDFFNQNSNPDPDSVTLVNAITPVESEPSAVYQNANPSNTPSITA